MKIFADLGNVQQAVRELGSTVEVIRIKDPSSSKDTRGFGSAVITVREQLNQRRLPTVEVIRVAEDLDSFRNQVSGRNLVSF